MSIVVVASLINLIANLLMALVILSAIVSWILPPYHPLREALDRIIDPMLAPIRRVVPAVGMMDISPMILILLIWLVARILVTILINLG